jgi:pimeloyl-ACP methyl ester carboxylesterase
MWKKVLLGIGAIIVITLLGAYGAFYQPDIPRAVLEAKYAGPPSRFVELSYPNTLPPSTGISDMRFTDPNITARAHYRVRGPADAPALVLLHGSNSSLFDWEPWSKILSDKFCVISVDLPGHGLTGAVANADYSEQGMTVFVKAFADKLGLGPFAIGGNSLGGGVAARFAELYPDRVTRLILVDAVGMQSQFGDRIPLAFRLARTPVFNRFLLHITPRSLVVEGLNDAVERKAILTDRMIDQYWDFARMTGSRQATVARFRLPSDDFVRDHIGAIKAPTLILWGEEDRLILAAAAHAWAKAVPGSKLIVYPRTGHLPMEEAATESAGDVRAFLGTPAQVNH